jgi:phosphoribosylanthranilate isomerase
MKVKICGITNLEDALVAAEPEADYLGFVFHAPSQRSVTVDTVRAIAERLHVGVNRPTLVGVFVNETANAIATTLDACRLDLAQLSGDEVPSLVGDTNSPIYGRCYKALRPTSLAVAEAEAERYSPAQCSDKLSHPVILTDSYHPTLHDGTGEKGDWALSARLATCFPGLMLAGGLTADNVAEAACQVRPFAVDVASGVEASPGKKDPVLVRQFIARAKSIS